jgi:hypothetical protein
MQALCFGGDASGTVPGTAGKPRHFAIAKHLLDFCPKNHQMRFSFHLPAAA